MLTVGFEDRRVAVDGVRETDMERTRYTWGTSLTETLLRRKIRVNIETLEADHFSVSARRKDQLLVNGADHIPTYS